MPLETIVKDTTMGAEKGIHLVDAAIKKAWSIFDAAIEKKTPSDLLSKQGISAIQGKVQPS